MSHNDDCTVINCGHEHDESYAERLARVEAAKWADLAEGKRIARQQREYAQDLRDRGMVGD